MIYAKKIELSKIIIDTKFGMSGFKPKMKPIVSKAQTLLYLTRNNLEREAIKFMPAKILPFAAGLNHDVQRASYHGRKQPTTLPCENNIISQLTLIRINICVNFLKVWA